VSPEAFALAEELARIAGHDPTFLPPRWMSDGPVYRVQLMLDTGWNPDVMREQAKAMMRRKHDGPPSTIRYFEKGFARAHAPPLPLPVVQVVSSSEPSHEASAANPSANDWRSRRDRKHDALAKLRASVAADQSGEGGGGPDVRVVHDARYG
jgi:hypothetical protein